MLRNARHQSIIGILVTFAGVLSVVDVNAASATKLAAGSVSYQRCSDRVSMVSYHPPTGFDPLHATAAQLIKWGYPTRPIGRARVAVWKRFVTRAHLPATTCQEAARASAFAARREGAFDSDGVAPDISYSGSANWSGFVSNHAFKVISGTFKIPAATLKSGVDRGDAGVWVGIGSGNSKKQPLIQGGSEEVEAAPGSYDYSLWWQVSPLNSLQHFHGTAYAGDQVYAFIQVNKNGADIRVDDETHNMGGTAHWTGRVATNAQGEWILERPAIGGGDVPPLAAKSATITSAFASTSTSFSSFKSAAYWGGRYLRMHNCDSASKIIATPSALADSGFTEKITRSKTNMGDDYHQGDRCK